MVELASLQRAIVAASDSYAAQYNVDRSGDWAMLKIAEEAGELVQAYIRASGRSRHGVVDGAAAQTAMSNEVADLMGMCLLLVDRHNLDLVPALERKWRIDLSAA